MGANHCSPRGGGGGWSPHIYTERPYPKVGSLPFYTPFLTKKVPIPFYCCKCTVFQIWINHKNRKFVFSTFSQPWKVSVGPFHCPKWQIFLPFHILQLVKSLPFHIPEAWKRYPFRAQPPCIGHCRENHPPPPHPPGFQPDFANVVILGNWTQIHTNLVQFLSR